MKNTDKRLVQGFDLVYDEKAIEKHPLGGSTRRLCKPRCESCSEAESGWDYKPMDHGVEPRIIKRGTAGPTKSEGVTSCEPTLPNNHTHKCCADEYMLRLAAAVPRTTMCRCQVLPSGEAEWRYVGMRRNGTFNAITVLCRHVVIW